VGAGQVVSQAAWFTSLFVIAALVQPRAFGSVTIAMVMIQVAWLVAGSGTRGSLIVAPSLTRGQVWYALGVNVVSGLAVGLAVVLLGAHVIDSLAPGANVLVLQILAFSVAIFGMSIEEPAVQATRGRERRRRDPGLGDRNTCRPVGCRRVGAGGPPDPLPGSARRLRLGLGTSSAACA
jgi:hypothetical protein